MIRINLLPAGLRKRQSAAGGGAGIPIDIPVALVGALLVLAAAGFWAWIKWDRIPKAEARLKEVTRLRNEAETKAKRVDELKKQITEFEAKVNFLTSLIGRRVKWAHTLDDFCTLLGTDAWPLPTVAADPAATPVVAAPIVSAAAAPGESTLRVSCRKLALKEEAEASGGRSRGGAGAAAKGSVMWSIDLSFQLVGQDDARRGEYIKAFYDGLRRSEFWRQHNLLGDPEEFYGGDRWTPVKEFGLTECQQDLKAIRQQEIQSAAALTGGASPGASAGGRRQAGQPAAAAPGQPAAAPAQPELPEQKAGT